MTNKFGSEELNLALILDRLVLSYGLHWIALSFSKLQGSYAKETKSSTVVHQDKICFLTAQIKIFLDSVPSFHSQQAAFSHFNCIPICLRGPAMQCILLLLLHFLSPADLFSLITGLHYFLLPKETRLFIIFKVIYPFPRCSVCVSTQRTYVEYWGPCSFFGPEVQLNNFQDQTVITE